MSSLNQLKSDVSVLSEDSCDMYEWSFFEYLLELNEPRYSWWHFWKQGDSSLANNIY
jgi:hypothetical protein